MVQSCFCWCVVGEYTVIFMSNSPTVKVNAVLCLSWGCDKNCIREIDVCRNGWYFYKLNFKSWIMSGICFMFVIQLLQAYILGCKMSGNFGPQEDTAVYINYVQRWVSQAFWPKLLTNKKDVNIAKLSPSPSYGGSSLALFSTLLSILFYLV